MILININNNKKFYKNFYSNFDNYEKNILETNENQCLAVITNYPKDKKPNNFKVKIRNQYFKIYPPYGNIIHASDSPEDCEKELNLLLNENIGNFKEIGTYYSELDT